MTPEAEPPPPALGCDRVLEYAVLDESLPFAGHGLLFTDGMEIGRVPRLAISVGRATSTVHLLNCDEDWNALGISGHDSIEEAKRRAERFYPGVSARWIGRNVSEEAAERYLDEQFADDRCSFCNKRITSTEPEAPE
jgi:hypothetical protein